MAPTTLSVHEPSENHFPGNGRQDGCLDKAEQSIMNRPFWRVMTVILVLFTGGAITTFSGALSKLDKVSDAQIISTTKLDLILDWQKDDQVQRDKILEEINSLKVKNAQIEAIIYQTHPEPKNLNKAYAIEAGRK